MDVKSSVIFQMNDFSSSCFCFFREMKRKGELVDFKVSYENRLIVGHRLILATSIPYFRTLFSRSEEDVYLKEINPDYLEHIVNFAYSGRVEITSGNVKGLLAASKFLKIPQIYEACWEFLSKDLDLNNVWKIREIAEAHHHTEALEIADCYIREHFEAFSKSEDFTTLPFWYLKTVIGRDDVRVSSEERVCEAIIRWAKTSADRRSVLFKLFCDVRLTQLSFRYLTQLALSEEILQTDVHCKKLLNEATLPHSSSRMLAKFPCFTAGPRKYTHDAKSPEARDTLNKYGIFAFCSSKSKLNVTFLDLENSKWESLSSFASCEVRSVVAFEGLIYVFLDDTVATFDVKTLNWRQLRTSYESHLAPKSILHNNKIYLFGVYHDQKGSMQCFDPRLNAFIKEEKMNTPLRDPGVASWCKYIYLTGGANEGIVCDTTQRYDPHTKEWTVLSPMLCRRWEHGCTTLNDMMYVCGGYYGGLLMTAEIYNPRTDQWGFIRSMKEPKWELTLVPYYGKLYTYPRRPLFLHASSGMEIYDPEINEWRSGVDLPDVKNCKIYLTSFDTFSKYNASDTNNGA